MQNNTSTKYKVTEEELTSLKEGKLVFTIPGTPLHYIY